MSCSIKSVESFLKVLFDPPPNCLQIGPGARAEVVLVRAELKLPYVQEYVGGPPSVVLERGRVAGRG